MWALPIVRDSTKAKYHSRGRKACQIFCFRTVLSHFSRDGHVALEKDGIVARQGKESVTENLRKKANIEIFCLPGKWNCIGVDCCLL